MSAEGSDLAEGIVPDRPPEHIAPLSSEFQAWHRVRKQYVRRNQWNELAKRNVKYAWRSELQRPSTTAQGSQSAMHIAQPLRCLVIPGNHLLDVRSLWNELSPLDCYVRYLGFNEGFGSSDVGTEVYVANNAVTSLTGVIPDSQVVKDRFEAIAGKNTFAHLHLRKYGPYHIVNLDLCGSMFPNTAKKVDNYFTALNRLLEYQFAAQKTLWLLFITTMVEPSLVDGEEMQKLCKATKANLNQSVEFAKQLDKLLPCAAFSDASDESKSVELKDLSEEQLIRLFGVALGKWLLQLAQAASPKWTVEMRRSYRYVINKHKGAVMLSLAFEMTPNFAPPVDASGMSKLEISVKKYPSESECAIQLATSVANILDIDGELSKDSLLKTSLREEAADLLAAAGFDRAEYIKWVDSGEPGPEG